MAVKETDVVSCLQFFLNNQQWASYSESQQLLFHKIHGAGPLHLIDTRHMSVYILPAVHN